MTISYSNRRANGGKFSDCVTTPNDVSQVPDGSPDNGCTSGQCTGSGKTQEHYERFSANQILTNLLFPTMLLSQSDLSINFNMAVSWIVRVLLLICSFFEYFADDSLRVNRFEYKFSFKGPHLVNKNGQVPFWTVGGSEYSTT